MRSAEHLTNPFWAAQKNPGVDSLFGGRVVMLALSVWDKGRKRLGPLLRHANLQYLVKLEKSTLNKKNWIADILFCQIFVGWLDTWICLFKVMFSCLYHGKSFRRTFCWMFSNHRASRWAPETWSRLPDILIDGWKITTYRKRCVLEKKELPSGELTYPLLKAFWRWFSFSPGGIC